MGGKQSFSLENTDRMTRLAICAVLGVGVVYAAGRLCEGRGIPLWEKYGPWITENQVQAIAIVAAVLYGASLALWPEEEAGRNTDENNGFTPCM